MATEVKERPVHWNVFNPRHSLFKTSANDRAAYQAVYCKLEVCPLRDAGCCAVRSGLLGGSCPYGRGARQDGPTGRAAKFSSWISDRKKEGEGIPYLNSPPTKLAFIGDYVYLPYSQMTMCKKVPFLSHSAYIISGTPFIPREDWVLPNVLTLLDFQPQAMMGGTITSYQTEQVPLFIQHIRELDAGMWAQLIEARPELDTAPNYVGRKALLKTLNAPITIPAKDGRYPVVWEWNGDHLTTSSLDAYGSTWGGFKLSSMTLIGTPADDAVIEVKDNAWVNEGTRFVD